MTTVLFENHHLYYLPQFIPVIDEMKKRGNYTISASIPKTIDLWEQHYFHDASSKSGIEIISGENEELRLQRLREREFDVIVVGNIGKLSKIVSDRSIAVMIYHGIGLKQSYYRDISERIDIRAVESENRYQELKANGAENIVLTGFTKLDPLFAGRIATKEGLINECNLDPTRETILYAPSFYPSSLEKLLPELKKLTEKVNVVVKLHNFSWHHPRYRYQSIMVKKIECDSLYLVPPEQFNILPYYTLADVLISDISSTMFEFLALNRPIIQTNFFTIKFRHRLFPRRLQRKLDRRRSDEIDFIYQLNHPRNVVNLVEQVMKNPRKMEEVRRHAAERYLYKLDGKASERLVDAIEERIKKRGDL